MAFIGATKYEGTAAVSSLAVPWACTAAGQECLLFVATGTNTPTITTPTGWAVASSSSAIAALAFKVMTFTATGTETGSLTVSLTGGTATVSAVMVAYDGINTTTPVGSIGTAPSGTTTTAGQFVTFPNASTTATTYELAWTVTNSNTAQTFLTSAGMTVRSLALSTTTTPFISICVWDCSFQPPTTVSGRSTQIGVATNATFGQTIVLNVPAADTVAEANGTTASPSWANETLAAPLTVRDALYGVSAVPTVGQLWPRGGIGSRG